MVLLHVKRSEKEGFLYNVPAAVGGGDGGAPAGEGAQPARPRQPARQRRRRRPLSTLKLPEQQGLEDSTPLLEDYCGATACKVSHHSAEARRQLPPGPERAPVRASNRPDELAASSRARCRTPRPSRQEKRSVQLKRSITSAAELEEAINNIRGAGDDRLPDGPARLRLCAADPRGARRARGLGVAGGARARQDVARRCFSKELQFEKLLSDYVGKNDKSKVVAKLQKKGAGAPGREPVVTRGRAEGGSPSTTRRSRRCSA